MRALMFAAAICTAGAAYAEKDKPEDAVEAAKMALGKADEAFNAHDAKGFFSFFDKDVVVWGPTLSAKLDGFTAFKEHAEKMIADGSRRTRGATVVRADADGNTAWFVADYTFVPKVPPGALPVHRPVRESGVVVKRGKEWKVSLLHVSFVQPDPKPAPPPSLAK